MEKKEKTKETSRIRRCTSCKYTHKSNQFWNYRKTARWLSAAHRRHPRRSTACWQHHRSPQGQDLCHYPWDWDLRQRFRLPILLACQPSTKASWQLFLLGAWMPNKQLQSKQAYLSGLSFQRKPINYKLRLPEGNLFGQEIQKPKPFFREHCQTCGSRMCCNGCSNCGACEGKA